MKTTLIAAAFALAIAQLVTENPLYSVPPAQRILFLDTSLKVVSAEYRFSQSEIWTATKLEQNGKEIVLTRLGYYRLQFENGKYLRYAWTPSRTGVVSD